MKSLLFLITFLVTITSFAVDEGYTGSTPEYVWSEVKSNQYDVLLTEEVTAFKLGKRIFSRAKKTITDKRDITPWFDKLLHSNGVCLLGKWSIDQETKYSGYFKKGSEAIVIARASTTLSGVKRGEKRGFGMALKLFPTNDFFEQTPLQTANIFTIDTLAGNKIPYYLESEMTNLPKIGITFNALLGAIVAKAFFMADRNPLIRQVYQVSELGETDLPRVITPKYFKISADPSMVKSEAEDFRDEIIEAVSLNKELVFNIEVAGVKQIYKKIGTVKYYDSSASASCDHRLHFNHPVYKDDLNHLK